MGSVIINNDKSVSVQLVARRGDTYEYKSTVKTVNGLAIASVKSWDGLS